MLIPYIAWSFIVYPYDYQGVATYSISNHLYSLYSGRISESSAALSPLWFLMSLFILQLCGLLYVTLEKKWNPGKVGRCVMLVGIFACLAGIQRLFGVRQSSGANVEGISYLTQAYVFFIPYAIGLCYWRHPRLRSILCSNYARLLYVLVVFLVPFVEHFFHTPHFSVLRSSLHGSCISLLLVMAASDIASFNNKIWIPFKQIGKETMAVYLFHWMILPSFLGTYAETITTYSPYLQFWINFAAAILISYTCIFIGKCVKISPLMGLLLMGQRIRKQTPSPTVKVG